MFCPKCGSLLRPKQVGDKKVMACTCGYKQEKSGTTGGMTITQKKEQEVQYDVIDKEQSAYPIMDEECPKCGHDKAYTWSQQMRAGDEPETTFHKCVKCLHTWREGK